MPRTEKASRIRATRKRNVHLGNELSKPEILDQEVVILKPGQHGNERGKAKAAAAPCDLDFTAPDLRHTPDLEDLSEPATQQAIRDTVDMMSTTFKEIKRHEHEIERQDKLANELGEVARQLRLMATLQVEQTRRLEEKLRYYRKTKVRGSMME